MEMITLTINGQTVQAPKNATILEAARSAGRLRHQQAAAPPDHGGYAAADRQMACIREH